MLASYTARGRSHVTRRLLRLWGTAWMLSGSELHTDRNTDNQNQSRESVMMLKPNLCQQVLN